MNWDTPDHIQYERASAALCVLDRAALPYACALGNHDTAAVKVGGSAAPGNVNTNLRNTTNYNHSKRIMQRWPETPKGAVLLFQR